jgi:YidC/Oxa1 family membrane protein insertase
MSKQMMYFMPLITVFIGLTLPGGVALYLLVTTILMILQQKMIFGNKKKSQEGENSESEKESESKVLEGEVSGDRAK